ncbi:sodium/proline symporter PutP [Campylobacter canadensis]|uniref:Sodium/proline symporter n=1 Tax=Campylobacter canadensis TaxID=449520 RepID=A0ABS7WRT4_9BACT|nr:sodium/proline symporter PutP [Campylobacter canadensis]MBZ7986664.1 sodium/proline symporter PutP [Campylobacter canadensis]MBZ7993931.1 sodium/proline symporter PutP [Campylobacter canadensis]MBZ7996247.1 sodium/proline symporter PutP [Campylobacter canadensis]MBZ7997700.1 sodium/proline symporter PutP [Campylobacter canadensis]MBZ7999264.1 sodium/proline symporter PutP [Campylobacter canadensis]
MNSFEVVHFNTAIIVDFILYSLLMIFIGFYFWRKNKNSHDYFLGDKNMGPVVSALSAGASDMSAWLLMGLPGAVLALGLGQTYIAIGLSIGATLNWLIVAKRLRIYTDIKEDCITIPDFFESRFNDEKHILRIICAFVILVFFTIYISSGLVAGAKLFEKLFLINYNTALIIGTFIIVFYTFLGGYKAVCWTDLIQGLLMMLALIVVPITMLNEIGGFDKAISVIKDLSITNNINYLSLSSDVGIIAIISSLAWGLGYFGQPHILVRFMSIKSVNDIKQATFIGISWMVISLLGAIMVGFLGIAYLKVSNVSLNDPERIFILMSQILFNPWVAGILLSAILAAIMSTASSQLLVSSSTLAQDFYKKIFKKDASNKTIMFISRLSVLIVSLIAFLLSTNENSSILKIVSYAWAGFGASFGSVILLSLFWKNMSRFGAILGMAAGAICVIIWESIQANMLFKSAIFELYSIIPAFIVAVVFIIIGSLLKKDDSYLIHEKMLKNLK